MKILLFILLAVVSTSQAQQVDSEIERALQYYQDGRHEDVVRILKDSDLPQARLFSAKSDYALGNFDKTVRTAGYLLADSNPIFVQEATLILAMAQFQLGDYASAVNNLDNLLESADVVLQSIYDLALSFKKQVVSYLSYQQRLDIVGKIKHAETRRSIVLDFTYRYPRNLSEQLIDQLGRYDSQFNSSLARSGIRDVSQVIKLPDSVEYPTGSIIKLGVILPTFSNDASNRSISSGLFNGILVAVDEYNRTHSNRKVQLLYFSTDQISRSFDSELNKFITDNRIQALIGPLYSDQMNTIAAIATKLRIPVFAPLANTFERNSNTDVVFQINPSFSSRGRSTARIAVERLGLTSFGIMVEKDTQGELDAKAFADEVVTLGGRVPYYFSEDFASMGYFVGDRTPWFANNQALVDSTEFIIDTLDAVYFPYTGEVASTLLNLTLTGLEAYTPNYVVLGNDEMMYVEHSSDRLRRLKMMYTSTSYIDEASSATVNFRFDYLNRAGINPNSFSYLGYDIARYYLWAVEKIGNPDDYTLFFPALEAYQGLSNSVHFGSDRNNEALHLFKVTASGAQLIE
jgi:tetratricopeptide (TPR) repeat protein